MHYVSHDGILVWGHESAVRVSLATRKSTPKTTLSQHNVNTTGAINSFPSHLDPSTILCIVCPPVLRVLQGRYLPAASWVTAALETRPHGVLVGGKGGRGRGGGFLYLAVGREQLGAPEKREDLVLPLLHPKNLSRHGRCNHDENIINSF